MIIKITKKEIINYLFKKFIHFISCFNFIFRIALFDFYFLFALNVINCRNIMITFFRLNIAFYKWTVLFTNPTFQLLIKDKKCKLQHINAILFYSRDRVSKTVS